MKIRLSQYKRGFTLIEMIGVLAVIAILAALLIPKIFEAINNARINNACVTIGTVKTAIADHYAKFGSLAVDGSAVPPTVIAAPSTNFAKLLLKEGFIDKDFAVKIGNPGQSSIQLVAGVGPAIAVDASNSAYNLDGDTATTDANDAHGSHVVQAFIAGVTELDARELSQRLDGAGLSTTSGADLLGRVKYADPGTGGTTTVYVYLTHR